MAEYTVRYQGKTYTLRGSRPPTVEDMRRLTGGKTLQGQGQAAPPSAPQEQHGGFFGSVSEEAYQQGERNIAGNIQERPAAATRGFIQGLIPSGPNPVENYVRGAVNPSTIPRFQPLALDRYYQGVAQRQPGRDPTALQVLGGM